MNARSSARRGVARHPVLAFMLIRVDWLCDGGDPADCGLRDLAVRPAIARVFMSLGAGLAAFLVTAALSGQAGVTDLTRRSVRWRVPMRWYLIALLSVPVGATLISLVIYGPQALATPSGGWPRALAEVAGVFVLQLVLFQLAEEIGFTGFLQDRWQDRYHAGVPSMSTCSPFTVNEAPDGLGWISAELH
jgi:membrane protease YdiL (CAAX protease family)